MKQLSFLNDSFIVRALRKLKSYADDSLFFHFDFSVHHAKEHQKPYQTQVSSGLFYKITRGIDGLFGKIEGFFAKSAKESFVGSKVIKGLSACQNEALESVLSLTVGFAVALVLLYPNKKLGIGLLLLALIGTGLTKVLKGKTENSIIYQYYRKIFKAGDKQ